jgi:hypothetical protein
MIEPRPSVVRFVRAVARAERASGGAGHDSDVAQRILMRLHQGLGKLIGPNGFDVLIARALVLARRAHPFLVDVTAGAGGTLAGLDDVARDPVALHEGAMAIVSHFMELLVMLIGEELALRLARDIWPGATEEETK